MSIRQLESREKELVRKSETAKDKLEELEKFRKERSQLKSVRAAIGRPTTMTKHEEVENA